MREVSATIPTAVAGIDDSDGLLREDVQSDSVDVPVIKLVNGLIREALKLRATDIHVEPCEGEVLIRFRADVVPSRSPPPPATSRRRSPAGKKAAAPMDIAERLAPGRTDR